jgi:hypothetical protein
VISCDCLEKDKRKFYSAEIFQTFGLFLKDELFESSNSRNSTVKFLFFVQFLFDPLKLLFKDDRHEAIHLTGRLHMVTKIL